MITNIADLLNRLREAEIARIDAQGIKHTSTIGDMYEGLTSTILQRTLPKGADLRVVSGFAETASGAMSGQLDCMIVSGSGRKLPYTDAYVWKVKDVLAVIEVKKTLFSDQFATAYDQLRNLLELHWTDFSATHGDQIDIGPALQAYRLTTGLESPRHADAAKLPFHLEMLYRTLVVEQISPLRIIFGYRGFASEGSLREAFFDFIEAHSKQRGFGGSSLPSLIICGKISLVKLIGMPFTAPMDGERWLIYASSNQNPLYFLLEFIWTKLSHRFSMPEWFMSDLTLSQLSPVLSGKAVRKGDVSGWEYWTHSPDLSKKSDLPEPGYWEPVAVSEYGFYVFNLLCQREKLPRTEEFMGQTAEEKAEFQLLLDRRIIGFDGDQIVLLTNQAQCVFAPDGQAYVGENDTGRLTAWLRKRFFDNSR
ncbi:conserved hypothetical protein [Candidatus Koribacter versatilis Ellin345]|uniref:DUF6602 domain-containing protein n=1 Tax=Koribacter versatilis (strain Ellin345) TaxID=204669 RepID=Q1IR34_KORVE|nr:DUF6602 domain-containing protein [Candidatus Koribacter versatilis]ABF40666.1 conserved hypothetical protein [Candidatus Koribacter versatilis Ellin345]